MKKPKDNPFKATKAESDCIDKFDLKKGERLYRENARQYDKSTNFTWLAKHEKEDELIDALDSLALLRRLEPTIRKLNSKKIDVSRAAMEVSGEALLVGLKLLFSEATSEKVRADLLKHVLGIGGFSPTAKIGIERIDPSTPKEALLSMIAGASEDLKTAGFEVIDERGEPEDEDKS